MLEILPQIMMYIIVGYAFLNTLHFVTLKENSENIEHVLTGSLAVGFVYYRIAGLIKFSFGEAIDCIGITLSAIVIAYAIGRFLNSRTVIKIYDFLKIRESGKKYLWDDVMDDELPMKVRVYYNDVEYEGYLFSYESYSNSPNVALVSYVAFSGGNIIEDNSQDKTKMIMLNTSKANKVEIIYAEKSKISNEIELFCNDRRNNS